MIPKVTNFAGFQSYSQKPVSTLKPGQEGQREYYSKVDNNKPSSYLNNTNRWNSNYGTLMKNVSPEDYAKAKKEMRSTSATATKNTFFAKTADFSGEADETRFRKTGSTAHWKSNAKSDTAHNGVGQKGQMQEWLKREKRPILQKSSLYGQTFYDTESRATFGRYGENPRGVPTGNQKTELSAGSTKVTNHLPGYSGYIPKSSSSGTAEEQSRGSKYRSTFIKNNIVENYHVKIPGYSGHKPASSFNDRGAARGSCFSTTGEAFS